MRIRIGTLAAVICLVALGQGASALATVQVPLQWDPSELHLSRAPEGRVAVRLSGGIAASEAGQPDLPWILVEVPLPDLSTAVQTWDWQPASWQTVATGWLPQPAVLDRPESAGGPIRPDPDPSIYDGATPWPVDPVRFQGLQTRAGRASAQFLVCPVRWQPTSGTLEWAPTSRLAVQLTAGPRIDAVLPLRQLPADRDASFAVSLDATRTADKLRPALDSPPVEFLIVTTEELASAFQPLVEWKNRQGVPATIRTVEWIYDNYTQGVDQPERIRLFLRDAYALWGTKTVILGGEPSLVPIRYAQSYWWLGSDGGVSICTDHYYACLDGDWNADGDHLWGESIGPYNGTTDRADLTPELKVGRVSALNPGQVTTWLGKYMKYAKSPETSANYLDSILILGEVLFPSNYTPSLPDSAVQVDGGADCIGLVDTLEASPFGDFFTAAAFLERWQYWNNLRPGLNSQYLTRQATITGINGGHNLLFHVGHGDRDRLAVGNGRYLNSDMMGSVNGPEWYGLAFTVNCNSAAVDADCVGEAFQFAPNGGGVNYFGSTNLDFPTTSRGFQNRFFHDWAATIEQTPGNSVLKADSVFAAASGQSDGPQRFLLYSLMMLGDPDLNVWKTNPSTLQVTAPTTFTLGGDPVRVTVRRSGSALAGAKVCLYKAEDAMAVAYTDALGNADVPFQPTTTGTYRITVTHPLAKPYEATGTATAATQSYVTLTDYTITDDDTQGSHGNGNGRIEAGETVAINLFFANRGSIAASGVQAELRLPGAVPGLAVRMADSTETIGNVNAGANGEAPAAFLLTVDEAFPVPSNIPSRGVLNLDLVWTNGVRTLTQRISPEANRPDLELIHTRVIEIDTNGSTPDSFPTVPGEVIGLTSQLYNQGGGAWSHLRVRAVPALPGAVHMIDSVATVPELPAGSSAISDTLKFSVVSPSNLQINLVVEDTTQAVPRTLWTRLMKLRVRAARPGGLKAASEPNAVALTWDQPSNSSYIWGYRVFRSLEKTGPYERAGTGYVEGARVYRDENLEDTARFWYRVAAVDSSGIEGRCSDAVFSVPSPKQLAGWPRDIPDTRDACPTVEELNGWGDREVLVSSDVLHVFNSDGTDYIDGDRNPATVGRFTPDLENAQNFLGKPATADIDLDGGVEVVAIATNNYIGNWNPPSAINVFDAYGNVKWQKVLLGRPCTSAPALGNIDGDPELEIVFICGKYVWAFNHDGTSVNPNNPDGKLMMIPGGDVVDTPGNFKVDWQLASVALADVATDSDEREEIIFTARSNDSAYDKLYVINGVQVTGPDTTYGTNAGLFPFTYSTDITPHLQSTEYSNSSPAVGDFTSRASSEPDGQLDIVIETVNRLWAFDPWANTSQVSGKLAWSKPIQTIWSGGENPLTPSPALGDIDGDGKLDIAVSGGNGALHVWNGKGIPLTGFQNAPGVNYLQVGSLVTRMGSPILADLDGVVDSVYGTRLPEIVVGDFDGYVHALAKNGKELPGFPYRIPGAKVGVGLCAWDIDRDGHQNLIIQTDKVQAIQVLDFPASVFDRTEPGFDAANPWPEFRHDHRNTGKIWNEIIVPVITMTLAGEVGSSHDVSLRWHSDLAVSSFSAERQEGVMGEWETIGEWSAAELAQGGGDFLLQDVVPANGEWSYRVVGRDQGGAVVLSGTVTLNVGSPGVYRLHRAQPNPFNPRTQLKLDLPSSTLCDVRILDVTGRTVRKLLSGKQSAGTHELIWDGRTEQGKEAGSGIYFVRATAVGYSDQTEKLVLLK